MGQVKKYKMLNDLHGEYKFDFTPKNCLLFRMKNEDQWIEFVEITLSSVYDVAVITNFEEKEMYFLNKLKVNHFDKIIDFGVGELYTAKHHGLIVSFGEQIDERMSLKDWKCAELEQHGMDEAVCKDIYFYRWNPNKKQ